MVLLQRQLYFSKDPEGSNMFGGGGGGGGGGSGPPTPHPLDPHMRIYMMSSRPSDERISSTCIM